MEKVSVEKLAQEIEATAEECKKFIGLSLTPDVDEMMRAVQFYTSSHTYIQMKLLDIAKIQFQQRANGKELQQIWDDLVADEMKSIDPKQFRSATERQKQVESALEGNVVKESLALHKHKVDATETIIKQLRDTWTAVDKKRHDVQTLVDLLKLKHGQVQPVKS